MKPRVFISHSSQDPTLTSEVSRALETPTETHPGFEVLVDTDCLQAGQGWPEQLHSMMAYAHAGLLLFTPAAMARPDWIRKEAYILTWRQSLDPKFKVFYAYRDGVTAKELTATGFAPAHLHLIQALKATEPADIAAEVKMYGPPPPATKTPFELLTSYLAENLALSPEALDQLARDLGAPPVIPWLQGSVTLGVGRIAARVLAGQFGVIENLSALINKLKALAIPPESLRRVMRWVAPYWIAPEATGRLAAATFELWTNKTGGLTAVNGECVPRYTARMLVYKAHPFNFECQVVEVEIGTHKADAEYYTSAICKSLRKDDLKKPHWAQVDYPDDDAELMRELIRTKARLFIPIRTPDEQTIQTLRANFPTAVFLLWTGATLEPIPYALPVVPLEPPVDSARETDEYAQWKHALTAIGA